MKMTTHENAEDITGDLEITASLSGDHAFGPTDCILTTDYAGTRIASSAAVRSLPSFSCASGVSFSSPLVR